MVPSDANVTQDPVLTELIFRLPRLWIGYLIAILSFAAGVFELARNPGAYASSGEFPAIYLIGAAFGWFYWLFCVYRYHDVITDIPGYNHPIAASRAVAFHFIPFYNFYWVYRWPSAIAEFVNWRTQSKTMKGWVPGSFVLCRGAHSKDYRLIPGSASALYCGRLHLTQPAKGTVGSARSRFCSGFSS